MSEFAPFSIAIPLFERLTALDAVGPYEILQRLPGATVTFVAEQIGEVRTENGFLALLADATYDDVPQPDVVVVPGGIGTQDVIADEGHPLLRWLEMVHPDTRYTTSVCTGALVLAKAGLLDAKLATTHWSRRKELADLGAVPSGRRVVEHLDDRIITAAGVSSGIDMALRLAELLFDDVAAKAMQLATEYDPQPPFDVGALEKADRAVLERLALYMQHKE